MTDHLGPARAILHARIALRDALPQRARIRKAWDDAGLALEERSETKADHVPGRGWRLLLEGVGEGLSRPASVKRARGIIDR